MAAPLTVEIWSDVVCPWCYIGKRRFESALDKLRRDPDPIVVQVVYRAYQLDPTAPKDRATPVLAAYAKKFGGAERAAAIVDNLTRTAAEDGLAFRMDRAQRSNTLLAHRLLWWAGEMGESIQTTLKEALLRAYFIDGRHVGDADELVVIATPILGVDSQEVSKFLASDRGVGEVNEELARAAIHGITGVPTYVINGQWAIPGAQDADTFERVLRRAADRASDGA